MMIANPGEFRVISRMREVRKMDVPRTMRAAVLTHTRQIEVLRVPTPPMQPGDVLIRIAAVGLCGSDVHFYENGRVGDLSVNQPLILGHEASGTIVAVSTGVDPDRIGERVAIEPQRPCRHCRYCLTGRYNLCESIQFFSAPPVDGAFAEYLPVPGDFAYTVGENVTDDAAALIEPLSVAIAAVRKAAIVPGSRVLVTGAGPIGLLAAQAARAFGAAAVTVSDPLAARRQASLTHGANLTLDPATESPEEKSVDAFIDASGNSAAVRAGMRALRPGGRCVLVGMGSPTIPVDVFLMQSRELTVSGLFRYVDTWPTAIALLESGAVDLDSLVSAHLTLERLEWAMDHNADEDILKFIVKP
jgi:L-iditol 2-dehydrogenase